MKEKPASLWNIWDLLRADAFPKAPIVKKYKLWVGCPHAEEDHRTDPRVFAHTNCQRHTVCVSPRLMHLPAAIQAGILAHEIGHLLAHHWWRDWSEEAADGAILTYLGWKIDYRPPQFLQELQGETLKRIKERLP